MKGNTFYISFLLYRKYRVALKCKILIPIEQKALRAGCALAQVELCRKRLCSARQSVSRLIGNVYSRECAGHTLFYALAVLVREKIQEKDIYMPNEDIAFSERKLGYDKVTNKKGVRKKRNTFVKAKKYLKTKNQ